MDMTSVAGMSTLLQKGSRVALGEECTTWGPGEFETERVVGTFGGG